MYRYVAGQKAENTRETKRNVVAFEAACECRGKGCFLFILRSEQAPGVCVKRRVREVRPFYAFYAAWTGRQIYLSNMRYAVTFYEYVTSFLRAAFERCLCYTARAMPIYARIYLPTRRRMFYCASAREEL